jgi:hypothetical protein
MGGPPAIFVQVFILRELRMTFPSARTSIKSAPPKAQKAKAATHGSPTFGQTARTAVTDQAQAARDGLVPSAPHSVPRLISLSRG